MSVGTFNGSVNFFDVFGIATGKPADYRSPVFVGYRLDCIEVAR
jgi:hypothetical protein